MRSLLALAKKLRVDAEAMIETVKAEKNARWRYTEKNPAFRGTLEFKLTGRVARQSRYEEGQSRIHIYAGMALLRSEEAGALRGLARVNDQAVYSPSAGEGRSCWATHLGGDRHPRDRRALGRDR